MKKKASIIACSAFSEAGTHHAYSAMPCEDACFVASAQNASAAVLCDGAGNSTAGGIAAKIVSELLAESLCKQFDLWYHLDSGTAKRKLAFMVEDRLRDYSQQSGIPEKELACTIVAAAMDRDKRCLCFHLGDGMVLQKEVDMTFGLVSTPSNGLVPNSTYLTMNCDIARNIHFCRWQEPKLAWLFLMTDGAANTIFAGTAVTGYYFKHLQLNKIKDYLDKQRPCDDYSCAIIEYNP